MEGEGAFLKNSCCLQWGVAGRGVAGRGVADLPRCEEGENQVVNKATARTALRLEKGSTKGQSMSSPRNMHHVAAAPLRFLIKAAGGSSEGLLEERLERPCSAGQSENCAGNVAKVVSASR